MSINILEANQNDKLTAVTEQLKQLRLKRDPDATDQRTNWQEELLRTTNERQDDTAKSSQSGLERNAEEQATWDAMLADLKRSGDEFQETIRKSVQERQEREAAGIIDFSHRRFLKEYKSDPVGVIKRIFDEHDSSPKTLKSADGSVFSYIDSDFYRNLEREHSSGEQFDESKYSAEALRELDEIIALTKSETID